MLLGSPYCSGRSLPSGKANAITRIENTLHWELDVCFKEDACKGKLNDCKELILPVINEVFGEKYTGKEKIELSINENIQSKSGDELKKWIRLVTPEGFTEYTVPVVKIQS